MAALFVGRYYIMIHCYKLGGLNIVLDVYSGSVHLVDEVAYDIIEMYENYTREQITAKILDKYNDITAADVNECCDDIESLKKNSNDIELLESRKREKNNIINIILVSFKIEFFIKLPFPFLCWSYSPYFFTATL